MKYCIETLPKRFCGLVCESCMYTVHRLMLPLPGLSSSGARVLLARPALRDPTTTDLNATTKAMILMGDLMLLEDETLAITGIDVLLDMSGMTFQHAAQMNPTVIKKSAFIMQVTRVPLLRTRCT